MDYEEFTKTAFKFIYKTEKYNKLRYIRLKIHKEPLTNTPHGVFYSSTVRIFLDRILFDKIKYSEEDMKVYIILIIAHELTHSLQNVDGIRYHSESKYRNFIEASADISAINYIKENYDILKEKLGYFTLDVLSESEQPDMEYLNRSK